MGYESEDSSYDGGYIIINQAYVLSYADPFYVPLKPKWSIYGPTQKLVLPGDNNPRTAGQCVIYVQYVTNKYLRGDASSWIAYVNSTNPTVGSIVVLDASWWGHVGVVVDVTDDTITVRSRNWRGLWIVSDDIFNRNDERIQGYII